MYLYLFLNKRLKFCSSFPEHNGKSLPIPVIKINRYRLHNECLHANQSIDETF